MRARKLSSIILLPLLLAFTLAACGEPPNSFINSTSDELDYISWHNDNGQLSGNVIQVKSNDSATTPTTVDHTAITGTLQNNHVTITETAIFSVTITGNIDNNNRLQISGADASGHSQATTWYPISQDDYNTIVTAFNAHVKLSALIQSVNNDMKGGLYGEVTDSTSSAADYQVQQDQQTIDFNNEELRDMGDPTTCWAMSAVHPAGDNFQLTNDAKSPTFATLNKDLKSVQKQWTSTKNLPIPSANISTPWRITQNQIDSLTAKVNASKKHVADQVISDQQKLDQMKVEYASQANQYNQAYQQHCSNYPR